MQQFLDYIQTGQENPVIKAAIAQIQILYLSAFTKDNDLIARFLALLVLYKYGYDFRGLLILEEYFARTAEEFEERITNALSNQRITYWLEYFAKGILVQLQKAEETLDSFSSRLDLPTSFWEINERQKLVLAYLDDPNSTVTNKKIQQLFKISQITASRDLAKLTSLGLLFSHGKGRSIYYTKV